MPNKQNLEMQRNAYVDLIEAFLPAYLGRKSGIPAIIYDAMEYSLMAGGKRLRPCLTLATADVVLPGASKLETVQTFAAAIEMIHTYSLIHDDLPAMDNDDLRRGKPTNHIVYGEAIAILAGDALLTQALSLGVRANRNRSNPVTAENILHAWGLMAELAGAGGMIGGQVMDITSEGKILDEDQLNLLQSLKTGCLLRISVLGAAILLGVSEEEKEIFNDFALHMGRAFQIQDDILDVEASAEVLGKTPGKDSAEAKATYVTLFGIQEAKRKLQEENLLAETALKRLEEKAYDISFLRYYLESMSGRKH